MMPSPLSVAADYEPTDVFGLQGSNFPEITYRDLAADDLGDGTFGIVRKSFVVIQTAGLAAVKEPRDVKGQAQLRREIQVSRSNGPHPHLLRITAVESNGGTWPTAAAMPICDCSWFKLIAERRAAYPDIIASRHCFLDEREYLAGFQAVLLGLAHSHSRGNFHLDLKPANILLGARDDFHTTQICDFGLSETAGVLLQSPHGTPGYMAPELAAIGKTGGAPPVAVGPLLDVYSACMVFAEVLTSRSLADIAWHAANYELQPLLLCSPGLAQAICSGLETSPADRASLFSVLQAVMADLHHVHTAPPPLLYSAEDDGRAAIEAARMVLGSDDEGTPPVAAQRDGVAGASRCAADGALGDDGAAPVGLRGMSGGTELLPRMEPMHTQTQCAPSAANAATSMDGVPPVPPQGQLSWAVPRMEPMHTQTQCAPSVADAATLMGGVPLVPPQGQLSCAVPQAKHTSGGGAPPSPLGSVASALTGTPAGESTVTSPLPPDSPGPSPVLSAPKQGLAVACVPQAAPSRAVHASRAEEQQEREAAKGLHSGLRAAVPVPGGIVRGVNVGDGGREAGGAVRGGRMRRGLRMPLAAVAGAVGFVATRVLLGRR